MDIIITIFDLKKKLQMLLKIMNNNHKQNRNIFTLKKVDTLTHVLPRMMTSYIMYALTHTYKHAKI